MRRRGEGKDELRVLLVSPPIPSDLIVASQALLDTVSVDPVSALEDLAKDARARAAMKHLLGTDTLVRCPPGELDLLREALAEARANDERG